MQTGAITTHIDVAQIVLYAFFLFFTGLVIHLLRESKREGFPLVPERGEKGMFEPGSGFTGCRATRPRARRRRPTRTR
jgi:hypothetical protein